MKKISLVLFCLILLSIVSQSQTAISFPNDFVETNPPKVESDEWYNLNGSLNEFGVSIVNGKLSVRKVREIDSCKLKITGGTLVGVNRGEFGGQLSFIPDDKSKGSIKIKRGNVKFIFNFKGGVYFIEGLAHMGCSGGALFKLHASDSGFKFNRLIDFDDAPEAFTIHDSRFLIATHENFYIIQDFKKELIFQKSFWSSLYLNSIAVLSNRDVYLGIRSGIVKLDLTTKTMKFYKYKD